MLLNRYCALMVLSISLVACHSLPSAQNQSQIADGAWRARAGVSKQASVALLPDGSVRLLDAQPRIIWLRPTLDTYSNEFAPCYLRQRTIIDGQSAIIERPCTRSSKDADRFGFQGIRRRGVY